MNDIKNALAEAEAAAGAKIKTKGTTMPTVQAIRLHKRRADQAVLMKWYMDPDDVRHVMPRGIRWDGLVDQTSVEEAHAAFAQQMGKHSKSGVGRIREGAVDTADCKMESSPARASVCCEGIWDSLVGHGFQLVRAHAYQSSRGNNYKGVIEMRFVHEEDAEVAREAMRVCNMQGIITRPESRLVGQLREFTMFRSGFCTVFSNTATVDPTITVNFRGEPSNKGESRILLLHEGCLRFV